MWAIPDPGPPSATAMFTIVAQPASEQALRYLLHWTDVWQIDQEMELFRIGLEIGCRFTFPDSDPRTKKVLSYLREHSSDWTVLREGWSERAVRDVGQMFLPELHLPERAQDASWTGMAQHRG